MIRRPRCTPPLRHVCAPEYIGIRRSHSPLTYVQEQKERAERLEKEKEEAERKMLLKRKRQSEKQLVNLREQLKSGIAKLRSQRLPADSIQRRLRWEAEQKAVEWFESDDEGAQSLRKALKDALGSGSGRPCDDAIVGDLIADLINYIRERDWPTFLSALHKQIDYVRLGLFCAASEAANGKLKRAIKDAARWMKRLKDTGIESCGVILWGLQDAARVSASGDRNVRAT